jgi:stage V sporulation protein D (sporulation-specific penicillin-binding protein)
MSVRTHAEWEARRSGSGSRRERIKEAQAQLLLHTQRRIEGTFYLLLLPLLFFAGRLVQMQGLPHSQSANGLNPEVFTKKQVLPARRAHIFASDGTALAVTLEEFDVCANPRAIKEKNKMARLIAEAIGGDESKYLELLHKTEKANGKPNYYVKLARHVDENRIAKLRAMMKAKKTDSRKTRTMKLKFWEPISLEASSRRHYPLGQFASQLIGFTMGNGKGVDGLEEAWNKELAGTPGEVVSQVDARNRPVPGFVQEYRPPIPGRSIVTTLDPQIQAETDKVLQEVVREWKPNFATAIVMRPQTGEIVAMTTAPLFDLNKRPQNVVELATNRCVNFAYEPGSTFKVITAAAAVEQVPNWQNYSFYCDGKQKVGKHMMHCWVNSVSQRRHGDEDLSESIRDSCNFGVYGFARMMGAPKMLEYAKKFGLTEPVKFDGLTESRGYLQRNNPADWSQEQLANFSFGQGMLLTPLQLVRVAGTIANDGVMMKPHLIKELRDEQGRVVKRVQPQVVRKVIEPETAREVTKMMERVIREGSASKFVWVPGYSVAGKTGSAQKADGPRGYAAGKFISSLVGFVPANKPQFVILVMADEPRGSHWGSEVCGPAFDKIANQCMLQLRLKEGAAAPAPSADLMVRPKDPKKQTD